MDQPHELRFTNGKYKLIPDEGLCDNHAIDATTENLCRLCRRMVSPRFLETLGGHLTNNFNHHRWEQLTKCAARGCSFCGRLATQFSDDSDALPSYYSVTIHWQDGAFARHLRINAPKNSPYDQGPLAPWSIRYHTPLDMLNYYAKWACTMYIHLPTPNNEDISVYLDGTSEAVSRRIKSCLHTCWASHPNCGTKEPPPLPRRVFDVETMRLHESLPDERSHYTALSYCWGGPQAFTTTTQSYPDFVRGVSLETMPKTIQDAVQVTQQLDIRYLWVDALCIIQDDAMDVATEINTMTAVFKNAAVVISAEVASSVQEGFLKQELPVSAIKLPYNDPDPNSSVRGQYVWLVDEDPRKVTDISTRGWVFQEFMLARRLLIYTRHGPIWSCISEQGDDRRISPHAQNWLWRKYHTAKEKLAGVASLPSETRHATPSYQWRQLWQRIVSTYAPLSLSYERDKLSAIAGIAREVKDHINENYVAGLWEKDLPLQLSWWRDDMHYTQHMPVASAKEPVPLGPDEGRVPSWSWAAIPGDLKNITFMNVMKYYDETALRVISCEIEPLNKENLLGAVKRGRLEVDAFTLRFDQISFQYDIANSPVHLDYGGSSFDSLGDKSRLLHLFLGESPLGPGWGGGAEALTIQALDDGTYRRVGCVIALGDISSLLRGAQRRRLILV